MSTEPATTADKINILLVDDQSANLLVLESVLAELGQNLVSVTSGEQALRQLLERDFAVVLMDVRMPTMSGYETAELIRSHPRSQAVPIIFLTAERDDSFPAEQAYALGAVDYLTKPINPFILRAKVAVFIDLYRKTAEIARHQQASHLAALRTRDERIRLILDSTRDYAFIGFDPDGIITEWEGGAENITGWSAGEACGQPGAIIFTPQDRALGKPEEEMQRALTTGRAQDTRWHLRRDGTRFFADGVLVPMYDEGERLRGFAKIFRDATAERLAAERLHESEAALVQSRERSLRAEQELRRLAAVTEQSSDFIAVADADGRAIYVNRAGLTMVGLPEGGAHGTTMGDFLAPASRARMDAEVMPALRGAAGVWEGELQFRHFGSGELIPVYFKGFAVVEGQDGGVSYATVTRDISAQKRAEQELRRIASDLAEADRRKSEFLATLAHELRNPLAPIRTGLDLLRMPTAGQTHDQGPAQNPAKDKVYDMMDRQLGHLIHLVNDLLDVARITRVKIELKRESTDLASVVAMAVETSTNAVDGGRHQLTVDVEDEDAPLHVDITRIVQVLSNILNNAAKYTPPGGRISVRARREGDQAVVAISDTGVGIPAEDIGTVFEMFTQVGRNLERAQGGLGIGLSLVRRLVELHGGTVSAVSGGHNHGSTFTVRLPLGGTGAPQARPRTHKDGGQSLRILVVDDDADAAESLATLLELRGHDTRMAFDGARGYDAACECKPQLAFVDIGMPGMNGHDVARAIRATPELKDVLLVALTGWGAREDVAQSVHAGFDLHMTKPIDFSALDAVFAAAGRSSR
ncbi:MAG: response regulator [Gammaproteobacteria bacterium]